MEKHTDELIDYQPGWIIRNGNLLFVLFFLALLALSGFIYTPEITRVPITFSMKKSTGNGSEIRFVMDGNYTGKVHRNDSVILKAADESVKLKGIILTVQPENNNNDSLEVLMWVNNSVSLPQLPSQLTGKLSATAEVTYTRQTLFALLSEGIKKMFKTHDSE